MNETKTFVARRHHSSEAGFSLMEVMIAVIVLATGLLALAALQGRLASNSADARIRSQVAAAVEAIADQHRNSNFQSIQAGTANVSGYTIAGVTNFNVAIGCQYTDVAAGTSGTCVNAGGTASLPQYKSLTYTASWTDATGAARSIELRSVVSPRTLSSSTLPFATPTDPSSESMVPIVRTTNPEVDGMIPIAIGDSSDTAATNPKPTVYSGLVKKTTFEVLTYQGNQQGYASDIVKQQRRVETAVVDCTCSAGTAPTGAQFERAQWPAYWDGNRYTVYSNNNANAPGVAKPASAVGGVSQDKLCTECCRDHYDTASGTDVKFDPYRSPHSHFSILAGVLIPAVGSTPYQETCRMVRVDGFWRTAQDMRAHHFGLLATEDDARVALPTNAIQGVYENFVLDYINANFRSGQAPQTADALYAARSLNDPASIDIQIPGSRDARYLHSRGLYVDNVEPVAQDKITKATASCTRPNPLECILPLLSFTSINMTELASWRSQNANKLTVDTLGINVFTPLSPNRGTVDATSSAVNNESLLITSLARKSNSGLIERPINPLTLLEVGIDTEDDVTLNDTQAFRTRGTVTSGSRVVIVRVNGGATSNPPKPAWQTTSGGSDCTGLPDGSYRCTLDTTSGAFKIIAGRYNYETGIKTKNKDRAYCPYPDTRYIELPKDVLLPNCANMAVNSVNVSIGVTKAFTAIPPSVDDGLVGTATGGWESTTLSFTDAPLSGGVITINLTETSMTPARLGTCSPAPPATATNYTLGYCP